MPDVERVVTRFESDAAEAIGQIQQYILALKQAEDAHDRVGSSSDKASHSSDGFSASLTELRKHHNMVARDSRFCWTSAVGLPIKRANSPGCGVSIRGNCGSRRIFFAPTATRAFKPSASKTIGHVTISRMVLTS